MMRLISFLMLAGEASSLVPNLLHGRAFHSISTVRSTRSALHLKSYSEEDVVQVMEEAHNCAYSDTCSIDDANDYLNAVVSVQGDCAANVLSDDAICGDADRISEIVALLRSKVEASETVNMEMASSQGEGKFSLIPVYAVFAGLTLALSAAVSHSPEVSPFTAQEWMWAARDGYLDTLLSVYLKNGGFIIDSLDIDSVYLPFSTQEWFWAIRDGYLDDMVSASLRNGGL